STKYCGQFYTVQSGETCRSILDHGNAPSDLFVAVNPSLVAADACDSNLKAGLTYCLHLRKPSTSPISGDVLCGSASPVNATCAGSSFGSYCFTYGYCGSGSQYCAVGAYQPAFRTCSTDKTPSQDGTCRSLLSVGALCSGSQLGNCCSVSGYGGNTSAYCG
ncbi:hypothetical protein BCR34DRAFT_437611, partial [Clohesyomyces aquaticus]